MGRLMLRSNRIKQVYPEWWGAESWNGEAAVGLTERFSIPDGSEDHPDFGGSFDPNRPFARIDATAALQACFDAAHRLRALSSAPKAAIPIMLSGRYLTSRPLRIGRRDADPNLAGLRRPFILRGRAAPTDLALPSIQANQAFPALGEPAAGDEDNTLMYVRGPKGFLIENAALSGRAARTEDLRAFSCLRIERDPEDRAGETSGDLQMARLRRCAILDAVSCLVQLGDFEHPYTADPFTRVTSGEQDLLGLTFEGCRFHQNLRTALTAEDTSTSPSRVVRPLREELTLLQRRQFHRDGIYFRAHESFLVHLLDCTVEGFMRAGVRTYGGRLTVTNSNFVVQRLPVPPSVITAQERRYGGDGMTTFPAVGRVAPDARDNGCDLYLEWMRKDGTPFPGVHCRGVESQSWRLLGSFPWTAAVNARVLSKPAFDVHLENVRHASLDSYLFLRNLGNDGLGDLDALLGSGENRILVPPAIEWFGPCVGGATLILQGVQVGTATSERVIWYTPPMGVPVETRAYDLPTVSRVVVVLRPNRAMPMGTDTLGVDPFSRVVDLGLRVNLGVPPVGVPGTMVRSESPIFGLPVMGSQLIPLSSVGTTTMPAQGWYLNLVQRTAPVHP